MKWKEKELHLPCFLDNLYCFDNMTDTKRPKQQDGIEGVESALSRTEQFIEDNQKAIMRVVTVLLILVAVILGSRRFYFMPRQKEALSQMFMAEKYFEMDSFNLALYGDGNYLGFIDIIDEYRMTKQANLAKYYAGISCLKLGEYQDAIEYLSDFKLKDKMVAPVALGALGDAYVELGESEQGIEYYMKAANYNENDFTTPMFLRKAAVVHEALDNYARAEELYSMIEEEFPDYAGQENIAKYRTRAGIWKNK